MEQRTAVPLLDEPAEGAAKTPPAGHRARRYGLFTLATLDFAISLGRKVGGFVSLLTLGWLYFRMLVLGHSLAEIYPGAADPDLRNTLWVALLLIMAQGWDITTDAIAAHWSLMRATRPGRRATARRRRAWRTPGVLLAGRRVVEPTIVTLGRFMDLCVAIANKVGAFAVLVYLAILAWQIGWLGTSVRAMYPQATDPTVSFLADLCVFVVVLGWWAMPFEQIAIFWRILRSPRGPSGTA